MALTRLNTAAAREIARGSDARDMISLSTGSSASDKPPAPPVAEGGDADVFGVQLRKSEDKE